MDARDGDGLAAHDLRRDPRIDFRGHQTGLGCRKARARPGMRGAKLIPLARALPQNGPVEIERLDDLPLRVLDYSIHLIWWQVDEAGRKVRHQGLELEAFIQRPERRGGRHEF